MNKSFPFPDHFFPFDVNQIIGLSTISMFIQQLGYQGLITTDGLSDEELDTPFPLWLGDTDRVENKGFTFITDFLEFLLQWPEFFSNDRAISTAERKKVFKWVGETKKLRELMEKHSLEESKDTLLDALKRTIDEEANSKIKSSDGIISNLQQIMIAFLSNPANESLLEQTIGDNQYASIYPVFFTLRFVININYCLIVLKQIKPELYRYINNPANPALLNPVSLLEIPHQDFAQQPIVIEELHEGHKKVLDILANITPAALKSLRYDTVEQHPHGNEFGWHLSDTDKDGVYHAVFEMSVGSTTNKALEIAAQNIVIYFRNKGIKCNIEKNPETSQVGFILELDHNALTLLNRESKTVMERLAVEIHRSCPKNSALAPAKPFTDSHSQALILLDAMTPDSLKDLGQNAGLRKNKVSEKGWQIFNSRTDSQTMMLLFELQDKVKDTQHYLDRVHMTVAVLNQELGINSRVSRSTETGRRFILIEADPATISILKNHGSKVAQIIDRQLQLAQVAMTSSFASSSSSSSSIPPSIATSSSGASGEAGSSSSCATRSYFSR